MARRNGCTRWALACWLALAVGPAAAADLFSGTWAPTCKPTAEQAADNELATIVLFKGALKVSEMECEVEGWKKEEVGYSSKLTCFRRVGKAIRRTIAVKPNGDKLDVTVSAGVYEHTVERCGN